MPTEHAQALAGLDTLLAILEKQNRHFLGHSVRVAEVAGATARVLGLPEPDIGQVRLAGRLHDLGMLAVPASVLNKPDPLTPAETTLVRLHPQIGAQIAVPLVAPAVAAMIRGHHERWDGSGYPDGLVGEAIPLGARILAVAEVLDALTSARAYRPGMSEAEALDRLSGLADAALDRQVVEATARSLEQGDRLAFLSEEHPAELEVDLGLEGDQPPSQPARSRFRWSHLDPEAL